MKDTTIAVGLAKNVFEIAISREAGKVSKQLRVSRPKLVSFFAKQSAATVLLEACGSAHFWARTLRRLGHDVVLLPPHLVRPYRRGSKNDRADTKALLEAYRNEEILSVPIKSVRQHTLAALHRLRSGWLSTRTARINAVRGILRELGLFIPMVSWLERNGYDEAAGSLREGMEETLTVVKLALPELLRQSLATTNAIENLNGTIRRVSRNVKRWKSPSMVRRWTALGVVTAEKEFRRIKGYRHMGALVHALRSKQKSLDSDEFAA